MDAVWWCRRFYARFALLRAGPAGGKEGVVILRLTARLKPCPDTCMGDGCGVAVQADLGCRFVRENIKKQKIGGEFMRASHCCARACGARKGRYFASCGTAKAVMSLT